MASVELVVARYSENLNWLRNTPPLLARTVYDKHPDAPFPGAIVLPNVGREAHSYLHHIVSRWDSLSDLTVFCQGKPFDHAFDFHQTLRELVARPEGVSDFRWLGHIIDTDDSCGHRLFLSWSKNDDGRELNLTGFFHLLFGTVCSPELTFVLGGQFAATRALIRSRPLPFWQHALEVSRSFPDAAHCFERSWNHVFALPGLDSSWLAGRKTVYLKPVKRLQNDSPNPEEHSKG